MKNPLRYPGSKQAFAPLFFEMTRGLHQPHETLVEPFAGSGAIAFHALENNLCSRVILVERDPLVFAFWESVFRHTEELVRAIEVVSVDIDTWLRLSSLRLAEVPVPERITELGFAGLFFNRANFSGIIGATPIGGMDQTSNYPIDCRFNKVEIIAAIRSIARWAAKVEVRFGNATEVIQEVDQTVEDLFFFVDPPYYKQGKKLYRHSYSVADHLNLARVLKNVRHPFFLTYDKHHVIEYLYSDLKVVEFTNRYSTRVPKMGNELLISNRELQLRPLVESSGSSATLETEARPAALL